MPAPPTIDKVRDWIGVPTAALDDSTLGGMLAAELFNQRRVCRIPDPSNLDDDLYAAIMRRCARAAAARDLPLGTRPGSDEWTPQRLSTLDSEIERYEGPVRKFVFG